MTERDMERQRAADLERGRALELPLRGAVTGTVAARIVAAALAAERAPLEKRIAELEAEVAAAEERGARWGIDAVRRRVDAYIEARERSEDAAQPYAAGGLGALTHAAGLIRGQVDAADVVRAAREREAPAAEPARPLAVGDRVRVVRCCPTLRAMCCGEWRGHTGELVRIVEGARLPYQIADPDGRSLYFAEVERVEPASEPEPPLTARQLAAALRHLVRGCAGDEPLHADFAEELAAELEAAR